ncbi:MAG: monovalent cation/H(+) antiporter subunit G [Thermoleophilaceae bacterium]|nr:monovalent cation/H(+) antiporter subunit G [Thermoleophilaceae bacterium]
MAADALVVVGLVVCTLGVLGIYRMPDVYTQLHAASKGVVFGVAAFVLASLAAADGAIAARAVLIAAFLFLTTPVAAHAVARAAHTRRERMRTPAARDESRHRLATSDADTQQLAGRHGPPGP